MGLSNPDRASATSIYTHVARLFIPPFYPSLSLRIACPVSCSAQSWEIQIEKLRGDRLLGRFFAASRTKLREIGERLGVRRLVNPRGCPIR